MTNDLIRLAKTKDMLTVADLDNEAFSPYSTAETLETFRARL